MHASIDSRTKDALAGAAVTLVAFFACLYFIVAGNAVPDPGVGLQMPKTVLLAFGLAASIVVHLAFVGIAARRLGRSVPGWIMLTLVTFPLGSIVAGVLLLWSGDGAEAGASGEPGKPGSAPATH